MAVAAIVGGVAAVGGAALAANAQSNASSNAASAQEQAAQTAANTQQGMYNQTQANLQPYMQSGTQNLNTLNGLMPSLTANYGLQSYYNSPEYAAQLAATGQQSNALQAQGAASGAYGSGNMASALNSNAQQNALSGYSTGLQDYLAQNKNTYTMYNTLAQSGQNAAAGLGSIGANTAAGIANTQVASGDATAQNALNQGQVTSNLAGSVVGATTGALEAYNQDQIYQNYLAQIGLGSSVGTAANNYGLGSLADYVNIGPNGMFSAGQPITSNSPLLPTN